MWACALCLRFWLQIAGGCCRRLCLAMGQIAEPEKHPRQDTPPCRKRLTLYALAEWCAINPAQRFTPLPLPVAKSGVLSQLKTVCSGKSLSTWDDVSSSLGRHRRV